MSPDSPDRHRHARRVVTLTLIAALAAGCAGFDSMPTPFQAASLAIAVLATGGLALDVPNQKKFELIHVSLGMHTCA